MTEYNLNDLFSLCGSAPKEKARGTDIFGFRRRSNQKRFPYLCISGESYSDPKGHIASITFPNMKVPFERLREYPQLTPMNRRARVFCTCPAFQYWGSAYHSTQEGYRIPGTGEEHRPPNIRDPMSQNVVCKHLIRVIRRVSHQTFPQLLRDFQIAASDHNASYVPQIEPVLYDFLSDKGVDANEIARICSSLTESTWEEILEREGLLVDTDD